VEIRELRCERHKHGEVIDGLTVVKCHQCSKVAGAPVYHAFTRDGGMVDGEGIGGQTETALDSSLRTRIASIAT
jgi:hypothetical protein